MLCGILCEILCVRFRRRRRRPPKPDFPNSPLLQGPNWGLESFLPQGGRGLLAWTGLSQPGAERRPGGGISPASGRNHSCLGAEGTPPPGRRARAARARAPCHARVPLATEAESHCELLTVRFCDASRRREAPPCLQGARGIQGRGGSPEFLRTKIACLFEHFCQKADCAHTHTKDGNLWKCMGFHENPAPKGYPCQTTSRPF